MILIDDGDRPAFYLEFYQTYRIDREREDKQHQEEEHRVRCQSVQFLDPESEDIARPHTDHASCLRSVSVAATRNRSAKPASARTSGHRSKKPRLFVNVPRLTCMNHPAG